MYLITIVLNHDFQFYSQIANIHNLIVVEQLFCIMSMFETRQDYDVLSKHLVSVLYYGWYCYINEKLFSALKLVKSRKLWLTHCNNM